MALELEMNITTTEKTIGKTKIKSIEYQNDIDNYLIHSTMRKISEDIFTNEINIVEEDGSVYKIVEDGETAQYYYKETLDGMFAHTESIHAAFYKNCTLIRINNNIYTLYLKNDSYICICRSRVA